MIPASLPHRHDIDGLRALAVVIVVAFHAGWLPGGFIGVDLFFVLSGYLMAGILASDRAHGRWSLSGFYLRRLRRLVPALVVMAVTVAGLGSVLLLPSDLPDLGRSLAAAATFTANLRFYDVANDYFQVATLAGQPLLHTWTLAVEMQFYLLFPLLLWLGWRLGCGLGRLPWLLLALLVASLAYGAAVRGSDPGAVFYFLPGRTWELLAGALVWWLPALPARLRRAATLAGAGLILAGLVHCRTGGAFPVPDAWLPVLGAVLVLLGRPGMAADRGLAAAIVRHRLTGFMAGISYALYLWHWPLLALARYRLGDDPGVPVIAAVIALSVVLAAASWRWLERPLLRRERPVPVGFPALAAALVAVFAIGIAVRNVLPPVRLQALPPAVAQLAAAAGDHLREDCQPGPADRAEAGCRFGPGSEPATLLLWGNSFARMWLPALAGIAGEHGVSGVAAVRSACAPAPPQQPRRDACDDFNARVLAQVAGDRHLRQVVVAANWHPDEGFGARMRRLVAALEAPGRMIHVVLGPPQPGFDVPRRLALARLRQVPAADTFASAGHERERDDVVAALAPLVTEGRIRLLDPTGWLCAQGRCRVQAPGGEVLYYDGAHLTTTGARLFREMFRPLLAGD